MSAALVSSKWELVLGLYLLLLLVTAVCICRTRLTVDRKITALLGILLLPVAGMLDWWWRAVWGSREEQSARRRRQDR